MGQETEIIVLSNEKVGKENLKKIAEFFKVDDVTIKTFPITNSPGDLRGIIRLGYSGEGVLSFLQSSGTVVIIVPITAEGHVLKDIADEKFVNDWTPDSDSHGNRMPTACPFKQVRTLEKQPDGSFVSD